jgi:hypothetical protein
MAAHIIFSAVRNVERRKSFSMREGSGSKRNRADGRISEIDSAINPEWESVTQGSQFALLEFFGVCD